VFHQLVWLVSEHVGVFVSMQELRRSGTELTDELEDEYFMSRLDAGLFSLQLVDYVMLDVCHSGPSSVCRLF